MANYAYYALHELGVMPWDFMGWSPRKQATVIAMIDIRIKAEKKIRKST
ncbi:hypothetical protein [Paenibacillus alvei]|jgi:hypothetical protein|nr:hypothetical protein [Paenibacillus alvei]